MAKTYGTVTTFTAGSVLTAAQLNTAGTAINNLVVPPSVRVIRTSDLTSYTNNSAISWSSAAYDTDSMFSAGSPTILTVQTAGLYVISFHSWASGAATITRILSRIIKNGTSLGWIECTVNGGIETSFFHTTVRNLAAGDTISASAQFVGGSAYLINGNASELDDQSSLSMTWIGRTS